MYLTGSTDSNLGRLIERYCERTLRDGEPIPWFVLETTTEGEAAARVDRIEGEHRRIAGEIKTLQRTIREHKKLLAKDALSDDTTGQAHPAAAGPAMATLNAELVSALEAIQHVCRDAHSQPRPATLADTAFAMASAALAQVRAAGWAVEN